MKKIIFTLLALVGTMSMNAQKVQVMKIMKNGEVIAKYKAAEADEVVFVEELETTGTAEATIGGVKTNVNWVQLWENGPKFAEYNVGASSATDTGDEISFTDATAENFTWGSNWRTPSKEEMDELLKAATSGSSTKVTCEYTQENGVSGFKFTGKETGYTDNSVFFPAQIGYSNLGFASYWSATATNDGRACDMNLYYNYGDWSSYWDSFDQEGSECLVRPVLK